MNWEQVLILQVHSQLDGGYDGARISAQHSLVALQGLILLYYLQSKEASLHTSAPSLMQTSILL